MSAEPPTKFQEHIGNMESSLAAADRGGGESCLKSARTHLAHAIACVCEMNVNVLREPLSSVLDVAARNNIGRRESAILVLRALPVDGLLPFEEDHLLARSVAELVDQGFRDQLGKHKLAETQQTYKKINVLKGLHEHFCSNLKILKEIPSTLAEVEGIKKDIERTVRHAPSNAYLQPFGWTIVKGKISNICEQISNLVGCKDATYKSRFDQLKESCEDLSSLAEESPSFLHREYVLPFVQSVNGAIRALESTAIGNFVCVIKPRRKPPDVAEKRYPLHQVGKSLMITIPFVNTGPGLAVDVSVELDVGRSEAILLETQDVHVGDVLPGEFAVSIKAYVMEPTGTVDLAMQVSWSQLFAEPKSIAFDVRLTGQDPNVDWARLEKLDPYGPEIASGDEFVGRAAKVGAIASGLLKAQMISTYITGQKRVGKSSLAQAVLSSVKARAIPPISYYTFSLEWGDYGMADVSSTVKALGEALHSFLVSHLTAGFKVPDPVFEGTLAPLIALAKQLEDLCPEKRFVIVIDEFDEIHPEMYRYGALADALFGNLRALGARKNLALILVGGEKMPFIINAQGDQLNKFVRVPLDCFSRADEWADYVQLIVGPIKDSLNWEESALNEMYSLTSGNPYYTKNLCGEVLSMAVQRRDTEIIVSDVRRALDRKVSDVDTNAFAHFWKDGIDAGREEAEVIERKRRRVLVAFGRTLREGVPTKETIAQHVSSSAMQPNEVGPLVDDFGRREIMNEADGKITLQPPFFERWLRDAGVSRLISSTKLADDLEDRLQKANDEAYVRPIELEEIIKRWPLYRGREITGEAVRAWLDQVPGPQDQRLLFKVLERLRFVTAPQINELLRNAHKALIAKMPAPPMRDSKLEKRRDLVVTYVDGVGKSGLAYARAYAKENGLLLERVMEPAKVASSVTSEAERPSGVVIVDDVAGTGRTLAESIDTFLSNIGALPVHPSIPFFFIVLFATEKAERKIGEVLSSFSSVKTHLHVCETLWKENQAFPDDTIGFWEDQQQRDQAQALCVRLGTGIYKQPLGFGSLSLLVALPETCPNHCLPIIFASRPGGWNALLPRPTS